MSKINLTFKGKKYAIDRSLLEGAIAGLEGAFGELAGEEVLAAGLYVDGVMIKSWDELVADGDITVEDDAIVGSNSDALIGDLVIADSIIVIDQEAFYACSNLTNIIIPNSVTKIGTDALYGCTGLTSLIIPDSVTRISHYALNSCEFLDSITFNSTVAQWNAISFGDYWNYDVPATYIQCSDGKVDMDGNPVLEAGLYKNGVMTKSWDELLDEGVITIKDGVVATSGYVEDEDSGDINDADNTSSQYLVGDLILPNDNSITSIGDNAFAICTALTSVVIPESVTTIGDYAFAMCLRLADVTMGENIVSIGDGAFYKCFDLTSVVIPNSVTTIGISAFSGCNDLISAVIGNGVTRIWDSAFHNCTRLTSITFNGTIYQWNAITKGSYWNNNIPATYVQCSNGRVTL